MNQLRKYNIISLGLLVLGVVLLVWMYVGSELNLSYCEDDFLGPLGLSLILFGLGRLFFRTLMQSRGRQFFGIWLILFGMYCYISGVAILPGLFGFIGGFLLIVVGVLFLMVDF